MLAAGWTTSIFTGWATCQKTLGYDVLCAAFVCVHYVIFMPKKKKEEGIRGQSEVNLK